MVVIRGRMVARACAHRFVIGALVAFVVLVGVGVAWWVWAAPPVPPPWAIRSIRVSDESYVVRPLGTPERREVDASLPLYSVVRYRGTADPMLITRFVAAIDASPRAAPNVISDCVGGGGSIDVELREGGTLHFDHDCATFWRVGAAHPSWDRSGQFTETDPFTFLPREPVETHMLRVFHGNTEVDTTVRLPCASWGKGAPWWCA